MSETLSFRFFVGCTLCILAITLSLFFSLWVDIPWLIAVLVIGVLTLVGVIMASEEPSK